jgi:hypothetical protein
LNQSSLKADLGKGVGSDGCKRFAQNVAAFKIGANSVFDLYIAGKQD